MKKKFDNNFMEHFSPDEIQKRLYENLEDWRMNYGNGNAFTGAAINDFVKEIYAPIDGAIEETLICMVDYCLRHDEDPRNWLETLRTELAGMIKIYLMSAHDVYIMLYNRNKSSRKKINTSTVDVRGKLSLLDAKINSYVIELFAHSDKYINNKKKLDAISEEEAKEKANTKRRRLKIISIVVGIIAVIVTVMSVVMELP